MVMKSITRAVVTLTAFTFAERTLGFLFKIYLSREIGAVGMGIYSVALSFFFVLLTLLTSGIPLVVSKITATNKSNGGSVCSGAFRVLYRIDISKAHRFFVRRTSVDDVGADNAAGSYLFGRLLGVSRSLMGRKKIHVRKHCRTYRTDSANSMLYRSVHAL